MEIIKVRYPGAPSILPLGRHGEPLPHLRHPHPPLRGQIKRLRDRSRNRPLLDWELGDQHQHAALLAQRGLHSLPPQEDTGKVEEGF